MQLVISLGSWLVWAACCDPVSAAAPKLTYLFPAGGQRGTTVSVKCSGEFAWPIQVDAPGVSPRVTEANGQLEIAIPADLPTDRVWLRLYNAEGASVAVPFLIGSLTESAEQEPNNTLAAAQPVTLPTTVNGVLHEKGEVDAFSVDLAAGQTLVAAVAAHAAVGSPMDSILQLASADGTVRLENHDAIGLDPRIIYQAPTAGRYIIRLFAYPSQPDTQIAYRGGADYLYRLTLTTGPYVTHSIPSTVVLADSVQVRPVGWNLPDDLQLPVVLVGGDQLAESREAEASTDPRLDANTQLGIATANAVAGAARVRLTTEPLTIVSEAVTGNSHSETPVPLVPPLRLDGTIAQPNEFDEFRVQLAKGQPMMVAVETSTLDSLLAPWVRLLDPQGTPAAEALEQTTGPDVILSHTAPADGEYRIVIGDRYRHGGDTYRYRLSVLLDEADFSLSVEAAEYTLTAEKPLEIPVTVRRRSGVQGAPGPIRIEIVGLPAHATAAAVVSEPTGPSAEKVVLSVALSDGASFSGPVRIVGTSDTPRSLSRTARTPARFGATFERLWLTIVPKPPADPVP